jgi:hypothetical protein
MREAEMTVILQLMLLVVVSAEPSTTTTQCDDETMAFQSAMRLKTWGDLYAAYEKFRGCDDGAIGEAYSDFVARTLANSWKDLPSLQRLITKDPNFRTFVIVRHIDATADFADLAKASANAKQRCPSQSRALCADIRRQADSVLRTPRLDKHRPANPTA